MFLSLRMHARHWSNPLGRYFFQDQTKTTDRASDPDAPNQTTGPQPHWCGGRRRVRRARPGFKPTRPATRQRPGATGVEGAGGTGGHGRASRSTTPSRRLACGDLAGGRARRRPEHQRRHKHQHAARTARGRAAAHRHTQRPGPSRQATRRPEIRRRPEHQRHSTSPATGKGKPTAPGTP